MTNNQGQIDDLLRVLEISRNLALNQDVQALLRQIEQAAVTVLRCQRATVFIYESESDVFRSLVDERIETVRVPAGSGIVGACFSSGKLINVVDAYQDFRFNASVDRETGFRTRNILAAPLFDDSHQAMGVLEVLNKNDGAFNDWDELLLETLSAQCGVALHRHALLEEFAEARRLQQELAIAERIQSSLLPQAAPQVEGYDIAGWNRSAKKTGGDFFDFHSSDDGTLMLMLADVSGHGIGPALLAAECWALQRAVFSWATDYLSGLTRINQLLCQHIPDDRFITAFAARLERDGDKLHYLSAGHGPVFVWRATEHRIETLPVDSLPLGIIDGHRYEQWQSMSFAPGDLLFAMTDGFFEWENRNGSPFGPEHLCDAVQRYAARPAAEIIERVYLELIEFAEGAPQQDDLTAIVVKKLPTVS